MEVSLEPVASFGVPLRFWKLPDPPPAPWEFFTFAEGGDIRLRTHWEFIALERLQQPPPHWVMRLLHLEEDDADYWPGYEPWRDAPGFLSLTPAKLHALIRTMEQWIASVPVVEQERRPTPYFLPVTLEDMVALGLPRDILQGLLDVVQSLGAPQQRYYLYQPDPELQDREAFSLVKLPAWRDPTFEASSSGLEFHTYAPERLEAIQQESARYLQRKAVDDTYDPNMADGFGIMRFNQGALRALISLLKSAILPQGKA